jgi:hypothetical protein
MRSPFFLLALHATPDDTFELIREAARQRSRQTELVVLGIRPAGGEAVQ